MSQIKKILSRNNEELGYIYEAKGEYCFVWLCGYHSDFSGSKATQMAQTAMELGASSLRFDYSGTGVSRGNFDDGTISKWLGDAVDIIENLAKDKKIILVGSSMGGWISLLLSQKYSNVCGLCLIAPAPDFTEDLMWSKFDDEARHTLKTKGYWLRDSEYSQDPYKVTMDLIQDGRKHLLLRNEIGFDGPVKIIHGMNDEDVPFERSIELAKKLKSQNVTIKFIKNGNHRLSTDADLKTLAETLKALFLEVQSKD